MILATTFLYNSYSADNVQQVVFLLFHCVLSTFCSESLRHCKSQAVRSGELKFCENVHPLPYVTCLVSHFMCHMSGVRCPVSGVRWHVLYVNYPGITQL